MKLGGFGRRFFDMWGKRLFDIAGALLILIGIFVLAPFFVIAAVAELRSLEPREPGLFCLVAGCLVYAFCYGWWAFTRWLDRRRGQQTRRVRALERKER